jgi:YjbE family integral membrane protein
LAAQSDLKPPCRRRWTAPEALGKNPDAFGDNQDGTALQDFLQLLSNDPAGQFAALVQVILIDIVFAGDNAVAVGLAAAGLPEKQRARAVFIGIVVALLARIVFALVAVQLMAIKGLLIVGGLLLLWIAFRMYEDLDRAAPEVGVPGHPDGDKPKTFFSALTTIIIADVTMSIDNVLGVASTAREHPHIIAIGLMFSVALMGVAASYIAKLIEKHRWIAWAGLIVIVIAALRMIWHDLEAFGIVPQVGWL